MMVVHPWDILNKKELAEKLNVSIGTVGNLMKKGLKYKKVSQKVYFTGQNILNYFNEEAQIYTDKVIDKVYNATGVNIKRVK